MSCNAVTENAEKALLKYLSQLRLAKKRVLLAPLNWGLGHASRCIPIIESLEKMQCEVILGVYGESGDLLKQTFPQMAYVDLPGFQIKYNSRKVYWAIFQSVPRLLRSIGMEYREVQQVVKKMDIDAIISDHRYGCYSPGIPSFILCHQLNFIAPFGEKAVNMLNHYLLHRFERIWVPDHRGDKSLAGKLSFSPDNLQGKLDYIGPITRFKKPVSKYDLFTYDQVGIISGPEPYRTYFEQQLIEEFKNTVGKYGRFALVRGRPGDPTPKQHRNIDVYNHLPTDELYDVINESAMVQCRSGYSSIMDLDTLKRNALFTATPGQTEQEYLAVQNESMDSFHA